MRDRACPQSRWVSVVDSSGRRRLEMRWERPTPAAEVPMARAA